MNLSPVGRPEGEGGVLLLAGAALPVRQLQIQGAQSEGWAFTRDLVFRDEGEVLLLLASSTSNCFFTLLVRELEDPQLRWHGEYCKSCSSQWHRGGAEWHERAI
jgi:hypothetical protein